MAAYRQSSSALATPISSGSVVSAHARTMPELARLRRDDAPATMATTRSRSREGLASISLSKPRRRMAVSTASTWPCAAERTTSSALSSGPSFSPFSTRRIISACSIGSADRLAMVRFLTRLPLRSSRAAGWRAGSPGWGRC